MPRTRPTLPAPALQLLRRVGAPAGEVARYWSAEARPLQRALVALLLAASADMAAGLSLGHADGPLERLPGLLVLIPGALAIRGTVFGSLGARLGTAMHTGQFEQDLAPGGWLWRQLEAAQLLTVILSVETAAIAKAIGAGLGLAMLPLWDLVAISVLGGLLAGVALMAVTVTLARTAQRRDWNMDDIGAPTITAAGDLFAIPALLLATVAAQRGAVTATIGIASTVGGVAAAAYGWFHPRADVRRLVRESVGVLSLAAALSVVAGVVIESRGDLFRSTPSLLVLFPAFLAMFGALGGSLASRLTSKLHLGLLEPRALPTRPAALDISSTYLMAVAVFTFVGAATWAVSLATGLDQPGLMRLLGVAVLGGLMGTSILSVVAYTASTATYRFGLDPDNHAIPIVTSTMDFLGMLCLVAALALLQVG